jgi:hypothetical protein
LPFYGLKMKGCTMPLLTRRIPQYRKHRATGRAIVTLSGRDDYLGRHGTKTSRVEYDRLVSEWLLNGRRLPEPEVTFWRR